MRTLAIVIIIMFLGGCRYSGDTQDNREIQPGDITAKISLYNAHIPFKKDFSVPIIIENNTNKPIKIDTSPDEVIEPPSQKYGGVFRERGSRCMLSVTQDQDNNNQVDFFSTVDLKVESRNKTLNSFSIKTGKTHTLEFAISPWGPTYGVTRSTAVPGPAEIRGELKILINGQLLRVPLEPVRIDFVN
jgi:hypothetical protein